MFFGLPGLLVGEVFAPPVEGEVFVDLGVVRERGLQTLVTEQTLNIGQPIRIPLEPKPTQEVPVEMRVDLDAHDPFRVPDEALEQAGIGLPRIAPFPLGREKERIVLVARGGAFGRTFPMNDLNLAEACSSMRRTCFLHVSSPFGLTASRCRYYSLRTSVPTSPGAIARSSRNWKNVPEISFRSSG